VDELGIDCCVFGVQKAFALPPGLAVFTASEKALERAKGVPGRGYYFDFLEFLAADEKNNTPSTPCISLIYAMDLQLERIFAEGLEKRWERHAKMAEFMRAWVKEHGFGLFPAEGYRSVTLTCASNDRGVDLGLMKKQLGERGFAFDDGYGKIKGKTFRVAHMGDMQLENLKEITTEMEGILQGL
jgi:aspartate aminotransferase-like enzyme